MKNLKKIALSFIAVATITLVACGDDDDNATPALTAEQKLAGNSFIIVDQEFVVNGVIVSSFDSLEVCDKDDLIIFNADKTGALDEGVTKCDSTDPQADPFTWNLTGETMLTIIHTDDNDTTSVTITQNDGANLAIKLEEIDDGDTLLGFISYRKL